MLYQAYSQYMSDMTRSQRLVLWIAITSSFLSFLDSTVVNVALPAIREELGGGLVTQQWVVNSYVITLGALILVAGAISDSFGRMRVIITGLIGFGITSVAIALAPTSEFLIIARFAQGAAGALLVPSSLALITSHFSGAAQAKAIGTWTAATTGALVVGPLLGGALVDLASWRWAFAINVIPLIVTFVLIGRLGAKDVKVEGATIDTPGAVLAALGLGGLVYGFIEGPVQGWTEPGIWIPTALGAVAIAGFVWREHTAAHPMMPLEMFTVRNFGWGNLATFFIYGALALVFFVLGIYIQEQAGLSATAAGAVQLPVILMMVALSTTAGSLAGKYGPRLFMTAGPLVFAAGVALLYLIDADFNVWIQVIPAMVVMGLGLALTVAPLTSTILGAIDSSRSGIASAVNNAVSRIAGLIAVALIGAVTAGSVDLSGLRNTVGVTIVLLLMGAAASFVGIRRVSVED